MMILFLALDELEPETVLEHAGLPVSLMEDMDGAIPVEDFGKLLSSAIALTGDEAIGLHVGQEFGIEMLDVVGMIVSHAPDLRTAIGHLSQYLPLVSHINTFELREEGASARLFMHLPEELARLNNPAMAEFCMASLFCMGRRLVDGNLVIRTLRSRLPAPPWLAEYPSVIGDDVELLFNAGEDSAEFDSYLLNLPMKRHAPGLYQQMRNQAARRLASLPQPESTSGNVRGLIDEFLGERLLDLPTIAERMGLTPRTLQRRLQDENTTFQSIYDSCRRERARSYLLEESEVEIDTLAAMMGYSEPANFYRAFKGWFGVTPSEYQRRHGAS
jgi:AraC-like DNA-binding protein